jgi:hypothetical protein
MTPLQLLASAPSTSGGMGWNYSVVTASLHPDHPAEMRQQNAGHRHLDDHRPASQGQPAAAHRPTKARQRPRRRTCNRRTPRPPNGVEQQPGRSPVPRAPSTTRAVERASTPSGVAQSPLRVRARPSSARARCPRRRAWKVCLCPWGQRGAIACGPAECRRDLARQPGCAQGRREGAPA